MSFCFDLHTLCRTKMARALFHEQFLDEKSIFTRLRIRRAQEVVAVESLFVTYRIILCQVSRLWNQRFTMKIIAVLASAFLVGIHSFAFAENVAGPNRRRVMRSMNGKGGKGRKNKCAQSEVSH